MSKRSETLADLTHLATPGTEITLRATPKAAANRIEPVPPLRIYVTAAPTDGKANAAILKLLAKSLGLAPSRLALIRGAQSREKTFRVT